MWVWDVNKFSDWSPVEGPRICSVGSDTATQLRLFPAVFTLEYTSVRNQLLLILLRQRVRVRKKNANWRLPSFHCWAFDRNGGQGILASVWHPLASFDCVWFCSLPFLPTENNAFRLWRGNILTRGHYLFYYVDCTRLVQTGNYKKESNASARSTFSRHISHWTEASRWPRSAVSLLPLLLPPVCWPFPFPLSSDPVKSRKSCSFPNDIGFVRPTKDRSLFFGSLAEIGQEGCRSRLWIYGSCQ